MIPKVTCNLIDIFDVIPESNGLGSTIWEFAIWTVVNWRRKLSGMFQSAPLLHRRDNTRNLPEPCIASCAPIRLPSHYRSRRDLHVYPHSRPAHFTFSIACFCLQRHQHGTTLCDLLTLESIFTMLSSHKEEHDADCEQLSLHSIVMLFLLSSCLDQHILLPLPRSNWHKPSLVGYASRHW